ncbi:hypothetical protein ACFULT_22210 [Rhodococcus sp. NPDC057297]|uniref:hypothetical protein n=1 Tax=Rhodococcus sp. NPDC057297 TaxID=3346090 RepID=UPI00363DC76C
MTTPAHVGAAVTASLFEVCALPGCRYPVTHPADVCASCRTAFGSMLRQTTEPVRDPGEVAAELKQRDDVVRTRYRERTTTDVDEATSEPEQRRSQICWLCTERRTCTRQSAGWECRDCAAVTG